MEELKNETDLVQRVVEEGERAKANFGQLLMFAIDLAGVLAVIRQLQIALRDPRNTGPSAERVRSIIEIMIRKLDHDGFPASAELARLGFLD